MEILTDLFCFLVIFSYLEMCANFCFRHLFSNYVALLFKSVSTHGQPLASVMDCIHQTLLSHATHQHTVPNAQVIIIIMPNTTHFLYTFSQIWNPWIRLQNSWMLIKMEPVRQRDEDLKKTQLLILYLQNKHTVKYAQNKVAGTIQDHAYTAKEICLMRSRTKTKVKHLVTDQADERHPSHQTTFFLKSVPSHFRAFC